MTVGLVLAAIWLIGWLLDIRPALRRRMLAEIQVPCDPLNCPNRQHSVFDHPVSRPRGSVHERAGRDAAVAVWVATRWPVRLLAVWFAFLFRIIGRGIGTAILSAKLTAPEMERRINAQANEIARLTKEIDEKN